MPHFPTDESADDSLRLSRWLALCGMTDLGPTLLFTHLRLTGYSPSGTRSTFDESSHKNPMVHVRISEALCGPEPMASAFPKDCKAGHTDCCPWEMMAWPGMI
jgi:hypothetical protein